MLLLIFRGMGLDSEVIKELVEEVAGKDVIELVELIQGKRDVSEFKIAEKLNLTVNQVRNMLYRLYSHNLVSFVRKKDKKKGWYIYYWTFDERKGHELFLKIKKEKLKELRERLRNETTGSYFSCPNECIRVDFETAMESDFKCPDCGSVLVQDDNQKRIVSIEKEIKIAEEHVAKPFVETPVRKPRKKPTRRKTRKKPTRKRAPAKRKPAKRKTTRKKPTRRKPAKRVARKRAPVKRKPTKRKPAKRKSRRKSK